jgi:hypothetical protein
MRLKAIREVRPVIGWVRISMERFTICPSGSMKFAETVWLLKISSANVADGMVMILILSYVLSHFSRKGRFGNTENHKQCNVQQSLKDGADDPTDNACGCRTSGAFKIEPCVIIPIKPKLKSDPVLRGSIKRIACQKADGR